jgi:hypothetical protein
MNFRRKAFGALLAVNSFSFIILERPDHEI